MGPCESLLEATGSHWGVELLDLHRNVAKELPGRSRRASWEFETLDLLLTKRVVRATGVSFKVLKSRGNSKRCKASLRDKGIFSISWFSLIVARTTQRVAAI